MTEMTEGQRLTLLRNYVNNQFAEVRGGHLKPGQALVNMADFATFLNKDSWFASRAAIFDLKRVVLGENIARAGGSSSGGRTGTYLSDFQDGAT